MVIALASGSKLAMAGTCRARPVTGSVTSTRSANITLSPNQMARFRMTPTTAAVMPVNAVASRRLPRNASI